MSIFRGELQAVGLKHIKIGSVQSAKSDDVDERLATFQTGNSRPLRVLGTCDGYLREEENLRRKIPNRIRGEWFKESIKLIDVMSERTRQYRNLLLMDHLLGKELTIDSLELVPTGDGLFNWQAMFEDVENRMGEGQNREEIVAASSLNLNPDCDFFGWYKGRKTRHYDPTYHLFFETEKKLFRLTGQFRHEGFDLPRLPYSVITRLKRLKPSSFSNPIIFTYVQIFNKALGGLLIDDIRLYF